MSTTATRYGTVTIPAGVLSAVAGSTSMMTITWVDSPGHTFDIFYGKPDEAPSLPSEILVSRGL